MEEKGLTRNTGRSELPPELKGRNEPCAQGQVEGFQTKYRWQRDRNR